MSDKKRDSADILVGVARDMYEALKKIASGEAAEGHGPEHNAFYALQDFAQKILDELKFE